MAEICQRHIVEGMDGKINPGLLRRNDICLWGQTQARQFLERERAVNKTFP